MAARHRQPEPELTREQLELGFRQVRRRGWPLTLDAALQDHTHAQLIRGMARCLSRQRPVMDVSAPRTMGAGVPVPPTPSGATPPRSTRMVLPRPTFDARRAAANDRGDD